jgi:hypothetical protein
MTQLRKTLVGARARRKPGGSTAPDWSRAAWSGEA